MAQYRYTSVNRKEVLFEPGRVKRVLHIFTVSEHAERKIQETKPIRKK